MKDNDFILSDEIKRFANHLTYEIHSPKRRREVRQEYMEHLEDAIYTYTLKGMTPTQAFRQACEDMGDTTKIQEMLAAVHNKDKLPRWVKLLAATIIIIQFLAAPIVIVNSYFLAWYRLILHLTAIALVCVGLYHFINFIRAVHIRATALKQLKQYATRNGHKLTVNNNPYLSLFKKTSTPEIIYETPTQRYIISIWATIRRKRTLHLTDFGFYSYSQNIGYWILCGGFGFNSVVNPIGVSLWGGLPKDTKWWYWVHSDIVEAPTDGMRFMPQIQYENYTDAQKENIYVLMLNPIPFKIDFVERGVLHKSGDDCKFGDVRIWSASGFMSYMDGRIMYEKKKFKSAIFD
ncbi:MAG: hypothetical protein IJY39_02625 [Clostridia bacterium]|nr:hypothetical protein [Clostridia bacterium]